MEYMVNDRWIKDAAVAAQIVCAGARKPSTAPAWMRCEYVRAGDRCRLGEGHLGLHEEEKEVKVSE